MNNRAKYIEVDKEKNDRIQHIRECFSIVYDEIDLKCKPGRETSLALTKLEEAQFWAIKGVTREKIDLAEAGKESGELESQPILK